MTVATTSRKAWRELAPFRGHKYNQILSAVDMWGKEDFTNKELADFLGWEINQVTGRTNELVAMGYLEDVDKRICSIGGKLCKTRRMKT